MANVEFHDYRVKVKGALEDACISYLYEAAGELEAQTARNSSNEKYGLNTAQNLWKHAVDESAKVATVGSPHEAAFWEEFGTGEYALNGDGRKGWWVYIEGGSGYNGPTNKYNSREEAEAAAAFISAKHNVRAVATNGREPNRPLHRAFTSLKSKLKRMAEQVIGGGMK